MLKHLDFYFDIKEWFFGNINFILIVELPSFDLPHSTVPQSNIPYVFFFFHLEMMNARIVVFLELVFEL
jgi:hypothetical protein